MTKEVRSNEGLSNYNQHFNHMAGSHIRCNETTQNHINPHTDCHEIEDSKTCLNPSSREQSSSLNESLSLSLTRLLVVGCSCLIALTCGVPNISSLYVSSLTLPQSTTPYFVSASVIGMQLPVLLSWSISWYGNKMLIGLSLSLCILYASVAVYNISPSLLVVVNFCIGVLNGTILVVLMTIVSPLGLWPITSVSISVSLSIWAMTYIYQLDVPDSLLGSTSVSTSVSTSHSNNIILFSILQIGCVVLGLICVWVLAETKYLYWKLSFDVNDLPDLNAIELNDIPIDSASIGSLRNSNYDSAESAEQLLKTEQLLANQEETNEEETSQSIYEDTTSLNKDNTSPRICRVLSSSNHTVIMNNPIINNEITNNENIDTGNQIINNQMINNQMINNQTINNPSKQISQASLQMSDVPLTFVETRKKPSVETRNKPSVEITENPSLEIAQVFSSEINDTDNIGYSPHVFDVFSPDQPVFLYSPSPQDSVLSPPLPLSHSPFLYSPLNISFKSDFTERPLLKPSTSSTFTFLDIPVVEGKSPNETYNETYSETYNNVDDEVDDEEYEVSQEYDQTLQGCDRVHEHKLNNTNVSFPNTNGDWTSNINFSDTHSFETPSSPLRFIFPNTPRTSPTVFPSSSSQLARLPVFGTSPLSPLSPFLFIYSPTHSIPLLPPFSSHNLPEKCSTNTSPSYIYQSPYMGKYIPPSSSAYMHEYDSNDSTRYTRARYPFEKYRYIDSYDTPVFTDTPVFNDQSTFSNHQVYTFNPFSNHEVYTFNPFMGPYSFQSSFSNEGNYSISNGECDLNSRGGCAVDNYHSNRDSYTNDSAAIHTLKHVLSKKEESVSERSLRLPVISTPFSLLSSSLPLPALWSVVSLLDMTVARHSMLHQSVTDSSRCECKLEEGIRDGKRDMNKDRYSLDSSHMNKDRYRLQTSFEYSKPSSSSKPKTTKAKSHLEYGSLFESTESTPLLTRHSPSQTHYSTTEAPSTTYPSHSSSSKSTGPIREVSKKATLSNKDSPEDHNTLLVDHPEKCVSLSTFPSVSTLFQIIVSFAIPIALALTITTHLPSHLQAILGSRVTANYLESKTAFNTSLKTNGIDSIPTLIQKPETNSVDQVVDGLASPIELEIVNNEYIQWSQLISSHKDQVELNPVCLSSVYSLLHRLQSPAERVKLTHHDIQVIQTLEVLGLIPIQEELIQIGDTNPLIINPHTEHVSSVTNSNTFNGTSFNNTLMNNNKTNTKINMPNTKTIPIDSNTNSGLYKDNIGNNSNDMDNNTNSGLNNNNDIDNIYMDNIHSMSIQDVLRERMGIPPLSLLYSVVSVGIAAGNILSAIAFNQFPTQKRLIITGTLVTLSLAFVFLSLLYTVPLPHILFTYQPHLRSVSGSRRTLVYSDSLTDSLSGRRLVYTDSLSDSLSGRNNVYLDYDYTHYNSVYNTHYNSLYNTHYNNTHYNSHYNTRYNSVYGTNNTNNNTILTTIGSPSTNHTTASESIGQIDTVKPLMMDTVKTLNTNISESNDMMDTVNTLNTNNNNTTNNNTGTRNTSHVDTDKVDSRNTDKAKVIFEEANEEVGVEEVDVEEVGVEEGRKNSHMSLIKPVKSNSAHTIFVEQHTKKDTHKYIEKDQWYSNHKSSIAPSRENYWLKSVGVMFITSVGVISVCLGVMFNSAPTIIAIRCPDSFPAVFSLTQFGVSVVYVLFSIAMSYSVASHHSPRLTGVFYFACTVSTLTSAFTVLQDKGNNHQIVVAKYS